MNILNKLERAAEKLIAQIDNDLQEPILHAMSGEVFKHGEEARMIQKKKESFEAGLTQANSLDNGGESKSPELGENFSR